MDKSVLRLLDEVKELLKPTLTDYSTQSRQVVFFEYLVPSGFMAAKTDRIQHIWKDYATHSDPNFNYKVLHGHGINECCAAPKFCHMDGYLPEISDNPKFIRNFYITWRERYPSNLQDAVLKEISKSINIQGDNPKYIILNEINWEGFGG